MNILRPKAAAEKVGVSRMQLHRWATQPEYSHLGFPKKISLGEGSVGFIEAEIDDWLSARAAQRDDASPPG